MMVLARFFSVFLRRYLSMKSLRLCLILLPVLSAAAVYLLQSPTSTTGIQVGIVAQSQTPYAQQTVARLTDRQDVTFLQYQNLDQLVDAVTNGSIVAGYALSPSFDTQISALQTEHLVQLIKLEDDIYHNYTNELVYSAIYPCLVPHITQVFLEERSITTSLSEISADTAAYLGSDVLFTMELYSVTSLQSAETTPSPLPLVRGILAAGLLTLTLLATAAAVQTKRSWSLFTPHLGRMRGELYTLAPIYVLALSAGAVALLVTTALSPYPIALGAELLRLAVYQLALMAVALVLPRIIGRDAIVLLIPFLLLFIAVTHPIFFDITVLFPSWKGWLTWLPSYWYLG